MNRSVFLSMMAMAFAALSMAASAGAAPKGAAINQAAAFYHQGQFDSALARLETLKSQGPWKRRDSLSLFQYLGMASARLGRTDEAVGYFSGLLGLDSLFQFPRNEDPAVLDAFAQAQGERIAPPTVVPATPGEVPAVPVGNAAAPLPPPAPAQAPEKISMADSGAPGSGVGQRHRNIGIALGVLPLGAGWLTHGKIANGLALGLLQAGGIALSMYASELQSREQNDKYKTRDKSEQASVQTWQWVQRVSLSTAIGAYLFSLIASAGD